MRIVADLHIHSPYSRAVSKEMTLENLDLWAKKKGITVMGTGDFTHPLWIREIRTKLEPAEDGLYKLKTQNLNSKLQIKSKTQARETETRFMLTVEISSIYSKGGRGRRIHNLIFVPSIETAEKINSQLSWRGNLKSDGRPILGLDSKELAKIVFDIDERCMFVPAHCLLPTERIHTSDGMKEIQQMQKGDLVFTHTGKLRPVVDIYIRPYKGATYCIRPWYFRPGLETTPEHPFFAIKTQKHCFWQQGFCHPGCAGKSHCCRRHIARPEHFQPQWVQAKNLENGDVLVFPRFLDVTEDKDSFPLSMHIMESSVMLPSDYFGGGNTEMITMRGTRSAVLVNNVPVNKEFCRLAGYFVAEGSVNGRDAISFTFARHEKEYCKDVKELVAELFSISCAKEREKDGSIELIFYSKILQQAFSSLFYNSGGRHRADTKALPQWMLTLPCEKQAEIFKGWWRGDAGYTVSKELMNQMKVIALRLGIVPSIHQTKKEKFNEKNHVIAGRTITARHDLFQFSGLAFFEDHFGLGDDAVFQHNRYQPKLDRRHGWIDESFVYMPIRDIEIRHYEGNVYNLEVEEEHSYLAEFAAVHNCWTPWFSIFGSMSGFDSIEECFDEYGKYIYAIETGLSSDPAMNWRLSRLDNIALISNSDSHSLQRIGREANVLDCELSYDGIISAIKSHDPKKFLYTIEFYPEEGKYHYDGHRMCKVSLDPKKTRELKKLCPSCGKPVTVGVMNRVEALADRPPGGKPEVVIPFKNLVPLDEIIAESFGMGVASKKVKDEYKNLIEKIGSEFAVLVDSSLSDLTYATLPEVVEGISRTREGRLQIEPGYDGEYGHVRIFKEGEVKDITKQASLF